MKEIMIAELNKEELKMFKELCRRHESLHTEIAQLTAQQRAFWTQLQRQYSLDLSSHHYIKGNAIYTQVI